MNMALIAAALVICSAALAYLCLPYFLSALIRVFMWWVNRRIAKFNNRVTEVRAEVGALAADLQRYAVHGKRQE